VTHDNGRATQRVYDALVVLDDGGDGERLDRGWVLVERLDLEPRISRGKYTVAFTLVALDPLLPASGVIQKPWIRTMVSGALELAVL
jgi:hypothetical protein